MGAIAPLTELKLFFFISGVFAKIVVFLQKLNNYPLYLDKRSETIVVAIKILDLDPLLQQYYHFSPFHKSTTLALKNVFPNAPFGFLNSLYLFMSTSIAVLDANSTNLFLLVFLVQWYLVLRLQLSLLCSLKLLLLSCNVVNPHFSTFPHL